MLLHIAIVGSVRKMDKFDYVNIKNIYIPKDTIYSQKTNAKLGILVNTYVI